MALASIAARWRSDSFAGAVSCVLCGTIACQEAPGDSAPPDLAVPDLQTPHALRCELPYDSRLIGQVSTGGVAFSPSPTESGVWEVTVDATAGGGAQAGKNPFVYVDLLARKKAEITDVQSRTSAGWDVALKRWQIKLNGGDSGPGGVTVARVVDKTLAEVARAPDGPFSVDEYFDAQCELAMDGIGGIQSTLSDWYEYDLGTGALVPKKEVLVLKRRDGAGHLKVQLTGYYKDKVSGHYTLRVGELP